MDRHDAISYGEAWRFWFWHARCDADWQVPVGRFWTDQIRGGMKRRVRAVTDGLDWVWRGAVRYGGSGSDGQDLMRTGKSRLGGCGRARPDGEETGEIWR